MLSSNDTLLRLDKYSEEVMENVQEFKLSVSLILFSVAGCGFSDIKQEKSFP